MSIFKRGKVYWYHFIFSGQHVQESTKQGNPRVARQIEAAHRTALAKGEVGIREKKLVPTLETFKAIFVEWVRATKDNKRTQKFYETCFEKLLDFKPLARTTLDRIDEPLIEQFKQVVLNDVSRTTCNRYLSTLKKALRHAQRKLKLMDKLPVIELYGKEEGAERECEFVYTTGQYQEWLKAAREPLRSASILAHDGGICRGELLSLKRDCVHLRNSPDERGFWGTIAIRRGLKRTSRRRDIPISEDMAAVLSGLLMESKCDYVFTGLHDHSQPLSANTLADQHRGVMEMCSFHPDAGLHALRHTFLTEAGRHTQNVRALQRLAGHSRIETTMRYVHPDQEDLLEIMERVQVARTQRIQAAPATVSATANQQQAGESRNI
jgi:integrase